MLSFFKKNLDLLSGFFLLFFSVLLMILTPSQVPLYDGSDALSPRFLPYIVFFLIALLSVILIFQSMKRKKVIDKEEKMEEEEKLKVSLRDLFFFIAIPLFILSFSKWIGFTFASIIGLAAGLQVFGVKPWYKILLPSVLIPLIVEVGYRQLEIYLPLGFWENIIYFGFLFYS